MAEDLVTDACKRLEVLRQNMQKSDDLYYDVLLLLDCYMVATGNVASDVVALVPAYLREVYNAGYHFERDPISLSRKWIKEHNCWGIVTTYRNGNTRCVKWMGMLDTVAEEYIARINLTATATVATIPNGVIPIVRLAPDVVCRLVGIDPALMPRARGTAQRMTDSRWKIEWEFPGVQMGEWSRLMPKMCHGGGWKGGGTWRGDTPSLPDDMYGEFVVTDDVLNRAVFAQTDTQPIQPISATPTETPKTTAPATPITKSVDDRFSNLELDPPTPEDIAVRDAAIAADLSKINRRKQNVLGKRAKTEDAIKSVGVPDRFALIEVDAPKATTASAPQTSPQDTRRRVLDIVDMSGDEDSIAILRLMSQGDA